MRMGFDVVRFSNEEVRKDIDAVCARILRLANMQTLNPHPPFGRAERHLLPVSGEGWRCGRGAAAPDLLPSVGEGVAEGDG